MKKTLLSAILVIAPIFASAQSNRLIELLQPHDRNPLAQNNLPSCKRELETVFQKLTDLQDQTKMILNQCSQSNYGSQDVYRLRQENTRLTNIVVQLRNENIVLREEVRRLQQIVQPTRPAVSSAQLLDACNQAIPYSSQSQQDCFATARRFSLHTSTIAACSQAFSSSSAGIVSCLNEVGQNNTTNQQIQACNEAVPYSNESKKMCIQITGAKRLDLETIQACSRNNSSSSANFIRCLNMM